MVSLPGHRAPQRTLDPNRLPLPLTISYAPSPSQFSLQPSAFLSVSPTPGQGNVNEIMTEFGGADNLRTAISQLQSLLYAA
jgi:hypothetical protein